MIDDERANINVENKKKKPDYKPYDEPEFDEYGMVSIMQRCRLSLTVKIFQICIEICVVYCCCHNDICMFLLHLLTV